MGEIYKGANEVVAWLVYEPYSEEDKWIDGPYYDPYESP